MAQDPHEGTKFKGDTITLTVSKGPELIDGAQYGRPHPRGRRQGAQGGRLQGAGVRRRQLHGQGANPAAGSKRPRAAAPSPSSASDGAHSAGCGGAAQRHRGVGIDVLPDQGPARPRTGPGLPRRTLRDRVHGAVPARAAGDRLASPPRCAAAARTPAASTASRRSCRPSASATPTRASRGSSPASTSWPRPCWPRWRSGSASHVTVWVAVALSTIGLAILSLRGFAVGFGESITFVCAILYAVHIVVLSRWSTAKDAYAMATIQMGVIAALCFIAAAPGGLTLPDRSGDWVATVYMALAAGALAMLAQTWAQSQLDAVPRGPAHDDGAGLRRDVRDHVRRRGARLAAADRRGPRAGRDDPGGDRPDVVRRTYRFPWTDAMAATRPGSSSCCCAASRLAARCCSRRRSRRG